MTRAILCDAEACSAYVYEIDPLLVELVAKEAGWTYGYDRSGDRWDYCPTHPRHGATPDGTSKTG